MVEVDCITFFHAIYIVSAAVWLRIMEHMSMQRRTNQLGLENNAKQKVISIQMYLQHAKKVARKRLAVLE